MKIEKWSKLIDIYKANKRLKEKIDKLSLKDDDSLLEYAKNYSDLSVEELKLYLADTNDIKKVLESKSQYSLVAITVSTSLIIGLSSAILKMSYTNSFYKIMGAIITICSFSAILYLILAGILALICIGDYNVIYKVSPVELKGDDLKRTLSYDIELNNNYNTIRNNLMNTSYSCIKKSLISLGVLFFFILILSLPNYIKNESFDDITEKRIIILEESNKNISEELNKIEDILNKMRNEEDLQNVKISIIDGDNTANKELLLVMKDINFELKEIKKAIKK